MENGHESTSGRIRDSAQRAAGQLGDAGRSFAKEVSDEARRASDTVRDKAGAMAGSASEELASLRAKVESLLNDRVTPAMSHAAEAAEGYARSARDVVAGQAERAATAVKDHPLAMIGLIAALGFIVGRLTAPTSTPAANRHRLW